jgi:quercetin 2,3-dioxygenase
MMALDRRGVERLVRGERASDGAGVRLTRIIGTRALPDLDPFLLLDEFRSDDAHDYVAGFPDHPHRGFETVTYMLAGRMRHAGNKGNSGLLSAGSVQWMTAGRGIVHSEMPEQENGLLWGFQLWVNLPARDKMTEPRYRDVGPGSIPQVEVGGGVRVKVIAGRVGEAKGPIEAIATEPIYLDVALPAGAAFGHSLPRNHTAFVFVYDGAVRIGAGTQAIARGELAVLGEGERVELSAAEGTRLILVAGRPLKEPIARYGPFVMNTAEEIRQAIDDLQSGRF